MDFSLLKYKSQLPNKPGFKPHTPPPPSPPPPPPLPPLPAPPPPSPPPCLPPPQRYSLQIQVGVCVCVCVCVCMAEGKNHPVPGGGGFSFLPGPHAQPQNRRGGGRGCDRKQSTKPRRWEGDAAEAEEYPIPQGGGAGRIHHDVHYLLKYKSTGYHWGGGGGGGGPAGAQPYIHTCRARVVLGTCNEREEKETSSFSMMAAQFVESAFFTNMVTAVIMLNLIILGVEVSWMP